MYYVLHLYLVVTLYIVEYMYLVGLLARLHVHAVVHVESTVDDTTRFPLTTLARTDVQAGNKTPGYISPRHRDTTKLQI